MGCKIERYGEPREREIERECNIETSSKKNITIELQYCTSKEFFGKNTYILYIHSHYLTTSSEYLEEHKSNIVCPLVRISKESLSK